FEDLGAHIASARGLDHVPGGAVRDHLVLDRQDAGDRADAVTDGGWWADDLDFDASRRKDLLDQAIDRPLGDDGALVDDDDATAHDRDFREDVRRQDHGVLPGERLDERPDLGDLLGIEPDRGLVEDEDFRIAHERLRQADALPVPLRERADQSVLDVGDHATINHVGYPAPAIRARTALDL